MIIQFLNQEDGVPVNFDLNKVKVIERRTVCCEDIVVAVVFSGYGNTENTEDHILLDTLARRGVEGDFDQITEKLTHLADKLVEELLLLWAKRENGGIARIRLIRGQDGQGGTTNYVWTVSQC